MRTLTLLFIFLVQLVNAQNKSKYQTFFEKGNGNTSANYQEILRFYKMLDTDFETIKVVDKGVTDSGERLQMVIFSANNDFNFTNKNKTVVLINNGIHAGETDGIDASMQLFRDLATGKYKISDNLLVVAIPVYNIGGCLNRNTTTRVNQNGPEEYGFRGNGRNFDLNRDFIKSDTKNAKSFVEIFHLVNPTVFIDNHVSNGADYQYVLTYIMTEPKKLGTVLGNFMSTIMTPSIVSDLKLKTIDSSPYVNVDGTVPEKGFAQFFDSPRYTTGYASLFNCVGFVVETHMLKNYAKRVAATFEFMKSTLNFVQKNDVELKKKVVENRKQFLPKAKYALKWSIDSLKVSKIPFLGYQSGYKKSEVTAGNRLFYDQKIPFEKQIDFFGDYKCTKEIVIPDFYIVPKSFWTVTDLLKLNKISYSLLKIDTVIDVESYRILDYKTFKNPYEGHYPHFNTEVQKSVELRKFFKGDFLISTKQLGVKYLLETLEPEAVDSFFNWNFFDTILQQKEGYSDYVFEDLASDYLKNNTEIRTRFEQKKATDKNFAENPAAQLDWIHKNSPYYEKAHFSYPIYRILN